MADLPPQTETRATGGMPRHVGIIMDGNGRWAKARGKSRLDGHRKGADVARSVVRWADEVGIEQISLYAFSTENWNRPTLEVRGLMALLAMLLPKTLPEMMANGVRFCALGDLSPLPSAARNAVERAISETENNQGIRLILCLNYGGQQEILAGVRQLVQACAAADEPDRLLDQLTPERFREYLWCHDIAPLDLLIRTGGERRISNFHLWDAAYAELYFCDLYWPDFDKAALMAAITDYQNRERRFGKTSEQLGNH